jgi:ABC-type Fe3+-hydroxamate transport system substrate-binding protein
MKIVSLVPSITETLFDFGLTSREIIGRTKFCIHPEDKIKSVEIVGGTKNILIEKIKALNPDLIIANKEENVKEQVEALQSYFNVWVTEIDNLEDNENFLSELGVRLNKPEIAKYWIEKVKSALVETTVEFDLKYTYLIWRNPYMTIGNDTFIQDVLAKFGIENAHCEKKRYPEISIDEMKTSDLILLSTEPYPFQEKHLEEMQHIFPKTSIKIVDGEAFSWYGTHLAKCKKYFLDLKNYLENL